VSDSAYLEFDDETLYFECVTSETAEHTATATEHNVEQGANVSDHVRPGLDKVTLEVFVSNTPIEDVNGKYDLAKESVELDVIVMQAQAFFSELDVPEFKQSLAPTPGSLINAATSAIGDLISGKPAYKAQGLMSTPGRYAGLAKASVLRMSKANVVKDVVSLLDDWRLEGVVGKVVTSWKTYESVVITSVEIKRSATTGDAATIAIRLQEIRLVESRITTAPMPTETRGKVAVAKGRQTPSEVSPTKAQAVDKSMAKSLKDLRSS
jgi:hypothetical protein